METGTHNPQSVVPASSSRKVVDLGSKLSQPITYLIYRDPASGALVPLFHPVCAQLAVANLIEQAIRETRKECARIAVSVSRRTRADHPYVKSLLQSLGADIEHAIVHGEEAEHA